MSGTPDARTPENPRTLGTAVPCVLSSLFLFGFSSVLREMTPAARVAFEKEIPEAFIESWGTLLDFGQLLWFPLALAVAWGIRLFWKGSRSGVLTWFLWVTIVFTGLQVALFAALYEKLVFERYDPSR